MDILKIIYEHDITLETLSGNDDPRNLQKDKEALLESFLSPQKTWCRYYFTGTTLPTGDTSFEKQGLEEFRFGLNSLMAWPEIQKQLPKVVKLSEGVHGPATTWHRTDGTRFDNLEEALAKLEPCDLIISGSNSDARLRKNLELDSMTGIRERFEPLTGLLEKEHLVLMAEKAHHGMDIHLFSRWNLYEPIFYTFQAMAGPELRYFSINGKRIRTERQFYFETWSLERPPHGFQEVTAESRLR